MRTKLEELPVLQPGLMSSWGCSFAEVVHRIVQRANSPPALKGSHSPTSGLQTGLHLDQPQDGKKGYSGGWMSWSPNLSPTKTSKHADTPCTGITLRFRHRRGSLNMWKATSLDGSSQVDSVQTDPSSGYVVLHFPLSSSSLTPLSGCLPPMIYMGLRRSANLVTAGTLLLLDPTPVIPPNSQPHSCLWIVQIRLLITPLRWHHDRVRSECYAYILKITRESRCVKQSSCLRVKR
jgi:hypothetical protein